MSQSILLRSARQLLTLRGDRCVRRGPQIGNLEVIEDGSVFIQDGKIVSVGSTRRFENLKEVHGSIVIPAHNCVVMPGLVDPCIHLSLRGPVVDGKPAAKRRKLGDFYNQSLALMRSCLLHGTLHVGIRANSGINSGAADISLLRQLSRIGDNPVGMTRVWCPEVCNDGPQDNCSHTFDSVLKSGLADLVSLSAHHDFSEIRPDASNWPDITFGLDWPGGPAEQLDFSLQQISPASVSCHYALSPEERRILAGSKCAAVFKVGGTLLDSQVESNIRELLDEGGAVALGSGYDALYEPNFNMQLVLALAVRRLNLTIEEAIVAATINAAYAMNRGDQIGSLEPGKCADVLILNLPDYREIPRRIGVNHVAMVIRNGTIVINRTKWRVGAA